jgi:hypothetical protein
VIGTRTGLIDVPLLAMNKKASLLNDGQRWRPAEPDAGPLIKQASTEQIRLWEASEYINSNYLDYMLAI